MIRQCNTIGGLQTLLREMAEQGLQPTIGTRAAAHISWLRLGQPRRAVEELQAGHAAGGWQVRATSALLRPAPLCYAREALSDHETAVAHLSSPAYLSSPAAREALSDHETAVAHLYIICT
jgi:hypothetical protein